MKIFVEIAEAAERLEKLIDLAFPNDQVVTCRAGEPVAAIVAIPQKSQGTVNDVWALMAAGRPASSAHTSNHDEFYGENGLPN